MQNKCCKLQTLSYYVVLLLRRMISYAVDKQAPSSCSAPATNSLGVPLTKGRGDVTIFWGQGESLEKKDVDAHCQGQLETFKKVMEKWTVLFQSG
eukprot:12421294-Ditylum_brightwellii.AAC.1